MKERERVREKGRERERNDQREVQIETIEISGPFEMDARFEIRTPGARWFSYEKRECKKNWLE